LALTSVLLADCIVSRGQVPPPPLQPLIEILNLDLLLHLGILEDHCKSRLETGPHRPNHFGERGHEKLGNKPGQVSQLIRKRSSASDGNLEHQFGRLGGRRELGQLARGIFGYRWSSRSEAVAVAMLGGNPFSKQ
jgi:hypothetical protein